MYYVIYYMNFENAQSEVFYSYDEAYKRAVELTTKCKDYDYVTICKVDNNNKEQLIRVLALY